MPISFDHDIMKCIKKVLKKNFYCFTHRSTFMYKVLG